MPDPKRNPDSPWNPAEPAQVSAEDYEKQVVAWLQGSGASLKGFTVAHRRHLDGLSGEYEFDAVAEFSVFQGAKIRVLVECKRHSRPVERGDLLALHSKLEETGSQKAMLFATCGFQRGALDYAGKHGIATVTFVQGRFLFETRALGTSREPPPWVHLPRFAGIMLRVENDSILCSTIDDGHLAPLHEWLLAGF